MYFLLLAFLRIFWFTVNCVIDDDDADKSCVIIVSHSAIRALQLCSVPLDVAYSLQALRSALSDSAYTARSLRNSRQLLALYLAGSTKLPDTGKLPVDTFCWLQEKFFYLLLFLFRLYMLN